jgi:hypothetical protein
MTHSALQGLARAALFINAAVDEGFANKRIRLMALGGNMRTKAVTREVIERVIPCLCRKPLDPTRSRPWQCCKRARRWRCDVLIRARG